MSKFKIGDRVEVCFRERDDGMAGHVTDVLSGKVLDQKVYDHDYRVTLDDNSGTVFAYEDELTPAVPKFKPGDKVKVWCRGAAVGTDGVATVVPYDSKGFYDYRVRYSAGWHGVCYEDEMTLVEEAATRTPLVTRQPATYTIRKDGKGIGLTEEQARDLYNELHELLP